jgi:hypothetical protein
MEYIDGMQQIIMLDNDFDRHELVLILNNYHNSMNFLDTFFDSLQR